MKALELKTDFPDITGIGRLHILAIALNRSLGAPVNTSVKVVTDKSVIYVLSYSSSC